MCCPADHFENYRNIIVGRECWGKQPSCRKESIFIHSFSTEKWNIWVVRHSGSKHRTKNKGKALSGVGAGEVDMYIYLATVFSWEKSQWEIGTVGSVEIRWKSASLIYLLKLRQRITRIVSQYSAHAQAMDRARSHFEWRLQGENEHIVGISSNLGELKLGECCEEHQVVRQRVIYVPDALFILRELGLLSTILLERDGGHKATAGTWRLRSPSCVAFVSPAYSRLAYFLHSGPQGWPEFGLVRIKMTSRFCLVCAGDNSYTGSNHGATGETLVNVYSTNAKP
jgi:hypothetical protein